VPRKRTQLIHEGRYAAEIEITLVDDETSWSPIVTKEDVAKTDRVRLALRRGDVKAAAKEAKVFALLPVAGE
jgi:predicted transcriptional regulator